ncbi:MAG: Asp23/Gls24 family envelope stress response protein [Chloroflexota bacterium]|nr:Asp23/Gls24 family envelope stress response protein [Chloroflexota bacterium]
MPESEQMGGVTIAPGVLATIVSLTAQAVPGVARLCGSGMGRFLGRDDPRTGIRIQVKDEAVWADVYLIVESGRNMYQVGTQVQKEVAVAVLQMVGMPVQEVNVYIQDVE